MKNKEHLDDSKNELPEYRGEYYEEHWGDTLFGEALGCGLGIAVVLLSGAAVLLALSQL